LGEETTCSRAAGAALDALAVLRFLRRQMSQKQYHEEGDEGGITEGVKPALTLHPNL
jgi:hypothetical protein